MPVPSPGSPRGTSRTGSTGWRWPTRWPRATAARRPRIADQFVTRGADTLLDRAAWIDGLGAAAKAVTVLPGNPARGLPSVQGALLLFDDATGALEAVIDSGARHPLEDRRRFAARRPAPRPARRRAGC